MGYHVAVDVQFDAEMLMTCVTEPEELIFELRIVDETIVRKKAGIQITLSVTDDAGVLPVIISFNGFQVEMLCGRFLAKITENHLFKIGNVCLMRLPARFSRQRCIT